MVCYRITQGVDHDENAFLMIGSTCSLIQKGMK
jgi:hypothetical protein